MSESELQQDGTSSPLTVEEAAEKFAGLLSDDFTIAEDQDTSEQQEPEPKAKAKKPDADEEPESESESEDEEEGDEPEAETEESEEDEPSETDDDESEDTDTDEETETEEPTLYSVKIDGEERKVTLDEALKGYSRTEDYTRKTQALAEQRKAVEAEQAQAREQRETYAGQLQALHNVLTQLTPAEPDWDAVRRDNPEQYPILLADWQRHQSRIAAVRAEQERVFHQQQMDAEQQKGKRIITERDAILAAMPEWRDPAKAKAARDELAEYGKKAGFTDQDLNNIVDHRALLTLWKAMQYDRSQATQQEKKAAGKAKIEKVKTAKPGPQQSKRTPSSKVTKALQRARSTGTVEDTAQALELMDLDLL